MSEGRGESLRRLRELEAANRQLARERDDLRVLIDTPRNVMLFSFDLNLNSAIHVYLAAVYSCIIA